jgi:hypothetical protein
MKISGAGSESRPRYGSVDPDPDPYQTFMDPQHWSVDTGQLLKIIVHSRLDSRESKKKTDITIYAPMIYAAPCVMFLMRADT